VSKRNATGRTAKTPSAIIILVIARLIKVVIQIDADNAHKNLKATPSAFALKYLSEYKTKRKEWHEQHPGHDFHFKVCKKITKIWISKL